MYALNNSTSFRGHLLLGSIKNINFFFSLQEKTLQDRTSKIVTKIKDGKTSRTVFYRSFSKPKGCLKKCHSRVHT